jgi:hypothetical protein
MKGVRSVRCMKGQRSARCMKGERSVRCMKGVRLLRILCKILPVSRQLWVRVMQPASL